MTKAVKRVAEMRVERARRKTAHTAKALAALERTHALASQRAGAQIRERAITAGFRHQLPVSQRYVVTSAQDGAPLHENFFAALRTYCFRNDAALVVVPQIYRAMHRRNQEKQAIHAERFAEAVRPFLFAGRSLIAPNLAVIGDVKISPTKSNPLSGMDAMTLGASAIYAHPKLELRVIPTLHPERPTIHTTTGACTVSDYVDALAGKIAEFHHTIGACVVEIEEDGTFHLRQINAETDTGAFIDLGTRYTADGFWLAPPPLALVKGDQHVRFTDPKVHTATFGANGIVETLKPRHIVYHDLDDGYAVNPHHDDPFLVLAKRAAKMGNVREETIAAAAYIRDNTPAFVQAVVVASNHNDFLYRWMCRVHSGREVVGELDNAKFYHETALRMLNAGYIGDGGFVAADPFAMWGKEIVPNARFLKRDESFVLGGVELSLHFDKGPNGSRGSLRNMRRLGVKTIGAHVHSPGISEGGMTAGTSSRLRLEYAIGPSSWAHADAILYANGKRSLIFISEKGTWHA